MQINRQQSNLSFGRYSRRRGGGWFFGVWLFAMLAVLMTTFYFNEVQSSAIQFIYGTPTATTNAVTWATQAETAFQLGRMEESVTLYRQAAQLEPSNLDIQFQFVRALIYRSFAGRNFLYLQQEAVTVAEQAVRFYPDDARAQAMYTLALAQVGRSEEAIGAGIRAIELAPQWAEAHAYLSMAYRDQGRWRLAIESGERAAQLDPNSVDAKRALALSLAFVGEFDLAIQSYNDAIRISPRMDALYFELAVYYQARQDYDAAVAAYDQVLANDPSNVKAYTRKCETYFRQRDDARAQEACEQALALDANFPEAWRQLGMVRYTRRNYEGAIEAFETCASIQEANNAPLDQREIECWYLRGLAFYLLDQCELAVPTLQDALTMFPDENVTRLIYEGLGFCADSDPNFDQSIIPTPVPPTPIPPEPIGIY
jgi:tetratricopeptide (TPR) repeat protein